MPDTPANPINYGQFGQNFIQMVITAERINQALAPSMKFAPIQQQVAGQLVTVNMENTASVSNVVTQQAKLPDVWFTATVSLDFDLQLNVAGTSQPYKGSAEFALQMHVQTYAPLTIFLDVQPLTAADVKTTCEAQNLPAEILQGVVSGQLPGQFADNINQRLTSPETVKARTIDVLQMVNAATAGPNGASSATGANALTLGAKVQGTLSGGQPQSWTGPLDDTAGLVTLTVWAKLAAAGADSSVTATLLDSNGGRIGSAYVATNGATDFERGYNTIDLPDAENYTLRLEAGDQRPVEFIYTLTQA